MPLRNAHNERVNQARQRLDPDKLAQINFDKLEGIVALLSAPEAGERATAAVMGTKLLEACGLWWGDAVLALAIAAEAAQAHEANLKLVAEIMALRAEIEDLRAESSRAVATQLWQEVGTQSTSVRTAAAWVLDLYRQQRIHLTPREFDFLANTVPTWHGPLRPAQQSWLQGIVNRAVARTGLTPPPP